MLNRRIERKALAKATTCTIYQIILDREIFLVKELKKKGETRANSNSQASGIVFPSQTTWTTRTGRSVCTGHGARPRATRDTTTSASRTTARRRTARVNRRTRRASTAAGAAAQGRGAAAEAAAAEAGARTACRSGWTVGTRAA